MEINTEIRVVVDYPEDVVLQFTVNNTLDDDVKTFLNERNINKFVEKQLLKRT